MTRKNLYNLLSVVFFVVFGVSVYLYINSTIDWYFYAIYHCEVCHEAAKPPPEPNLAMVFISAFTAIVALIGIVSTYYFSVIRERRETQEAKIRIEKLELELAELRKAKEVEGKSKIII